MSKKIDRELKEYAIRLVEEDGRKQAEISRELDIPYSTLNRWVRAYRREQLAKNGQPVYQTPAEIAKREQEWAKQIRDLEEENAILKKAMHIFAKDPK